VRQTNEQGRTELKRHSGVSCASCGQFAGAAKRSSFSNEAISYKIGGQTVHGYSTLPLPRRGRARLRIPKSSISKRSFFVSKNTRFTRGKWDFPRNDSSSRSRTRNIVVLAQILVHGRTRLRSFVDCERSRTKTHRRYVGGVEGPAILD
jgi:hypothetical protein